MADIYCNCCGLVYSSHVMPCPRCLRCCLCGSKCSADAKNCPSCDYPSDATAVIRLERDLNPTLPANRSAIRKCERDWENSKLLERLSFRGALVYVVIGTAVPFAMNEFLKDAGVNFWVRVIVCTIVMFACFFGFLRLLRQGWFPGLVRKEP